jgi:hypothetical protein
VWLVPSLATMRIFFHVVVTGEYTPYPEHPSLICSLAFSLSATSIRSSIQLALRKAKRVPVSVTRTLPPNLVYDFPTISTLSAFVYGGLLMSGGAVDKDANDNHDDNDEIFDWQSVSPNSTIVKLRDGRGEPPLIVLHGMILSYRLLNNLTTLLQAL